MHNSITAWVEVRQADFSMPLNLMECQIIQTIVIMNFKELATHHDEICESLFHTIVTDRNHRLYKLLPALHESIPNH